ncbi:MAG: mechanosensitive ion channel family protein [Bacillota bacterium]
MLKIEGLNSILTYLRRLDMSDIAFKLALSAVALILIFIVVKAVNLIIDRLLERNPAKKDQKEPGAENLALSLGMLAKPLVFYVGALTGVVIVLEIFKVNVVSPQMVKNMGLILLKAVGVIVAARLIAGVARLAITQVFARREIKDGIINTKRAQTLESLLKNMVTYIVFFLAGIMVLQIFNVNTSAILASAGILGLAVGFGSQNLVKDIISGFFILFEDQFAVGDYVEAGGVVGVVEEIGLRTCKIRKWTGQLHIIPNGEITKVTNYNRGHMMAVVIVGVAYEEDIDRAMEVLRRECETARREMPAIVETPVVQGVVALGDFAVNIRVVANTIPGEQWAVERDLLRRFKNALDREKVEIPYPRRVITYREEYPGGEKAGMARPESSS